MKLYAVLLLLVTLSAACGLKCYTCVGAKSCIQTMECPHGFDHCSSYDQNGVMAKTCLMSSACISPIKCCKGDLCNGAITTGSSVLTTGSSVLTTGSSVLLLLVSSAIITLFL